MPEVFTVRRCRDGTAISRVRSFWIEPAERAVAFAQRIAGKYGLEYIRVDETVRLHHFRWFKEK